MDQSDLGILLSDWGCPTSPVTLYDTYGFEDFALGDLPGQDGWFGGGHYGPVQVVEDPSGSGMDKVITFDPPGTQNDTWQEAGRLLGTPHTMPSVFMEWDQYREGLTGNFWYADEISSLGWWAIQWDMAEAASASGFGGLVPLTAYQRQHLTYTLSLHGDAATVDVDGNQASADMHDDVIAEIDYQMEPTAAGGPDGPLYLDNFRISEGDSFCEGDLDGDDDTDQSDLGIFLGDWGCGT